MSKRLIAMTSNMAVFLAVLVFAVAREDLEVARPVLWSAIILTLLLLAIRISYGLYCRRKNCGGGEEYDDDEPGGDD